MIKLKKIINELQGKTLHIYDFDDTLVDTETNVKVVNKLGQVKKLSSAEFATYKIQPGERFDYSDFDKMIKDSKPITRNLEQIKKSASNPGIKTTVLTARRLAFPIMQHLKQKHNLQVYVVGVAGPDPELKANWIEANVKRGYKNIKFIDDSIKNLIAVGKRLSKYQDLNLSLIDAKTGQELQTQAYL